MNRKAFIKSCGMACLAGTGIAALLEGCTSSRMSGGNISGDNLIVPLSDFEIKEGNGKKFRTYVVLTNELLKFPICVYRHSEKDYTALWMRCTHQGAELQVFGDKLQCPAHGSEFTNKGVAQTGPADEDLRSFPVVIENGQLKISLKAV